MVDDLISRKEAINTLHKEIIKRRLLDDVNDGMLDEFDTEDILRKLPSTYPKKGEWIPRIGLKHPDWFTCSECTGQFSYKWNYCPNCGADMRGNYETD